MTQTNVAHHTDEQSKQMLSRFEEVASEDKVADIQCLGTSIQIKLKCGCEHVEHFNVPFDRPHYMRHFVELCNNHRVRFEDGKK